MNYNRIAVGQINTTVGAFKENIDKIVDFSSRAANQGAELICFPELAVCGYPPQDLLERPAFVEHNQEAVREIAARVEGIEVVFGYVERSNSSVGKPLHNAAAWVKNGEVVSRHYKSLLPTYDVFNEDRYFEEGAVVVPGGPDKNCAVTICEDIWNEPELMDPHHRERYARHPLEETREFNPELAINIAASPFIRGKIKFRHKLFKHITRKFNFPLLVANQVGGNDSLVFDGNSMVLNSQGEILGQAAGFEEELLVVDTNGETEEPSFEAEEKSVYRALEVGLSDYMDKCGFDSVVLGLSGGIDSSLTATIAADVLGPEKVFGIMMPTEISSDESVEHAEELIDNLGINSRLLPIQDVFEGYLGLLEEEFAGTEWDTTEENLQARVRGNILMAFSNKYNHLVLAPGNKSELAVGYCTLYGDMTGGMGVISDVPKTMVYELARYRNQIEPVIPEEIIEKPPSAELSPDQVDQDDLPPYKLLDEIIQRYVELHQSPSEIIRQGLDPQVVNEVVKMIDRNEYKRQQAAVGLKVTSKSFGTGRIMPIAQKFDPQ
ncbi:MAG: NAD+ synthase [bacterium]